MEHGTSTGGYVFGSDQRKRRTVDGAKGDGGEVKKENLNKNKGSSDAAFVFRDNRESRAEKENESVHGR
jgi:hypothetical protein